MTQKPNYTKFTDGTWDFNIAADMLFSFWLLEPLPEHHLKKAELNGIGIFHRCSCPQFNHYHICKHVLALGAALCNFKIPTRFSTKVSTHHPPSTSTTMPLTTPVSTHLWQTCGKRKAVAGASMRKRARALEIDE